MELTTFFKFLSKNLKVLLLIPLVTVTITYFLVKSLPDSYVAEAHIATGIVDKSGEINLSYSAPLMQSEIEQKFSNLIQMMQLQKLLSVVSYRLILHDLTETPFKKLSKRIESLGPMERKQVIELAKQKYRTQQPLSKGSREDKLLEEVISSMKYDVGSIKDKLVIKRISQSDYISVSFDSPNPDLSAFLVNTICLEFIDYYTSLITNTGERSVNYLSQLLAQKQKDLNDKMTVLKYYKIRNNVLNLPEQARIIFGAMIQVEDRQAELQKSITSIASAIQAIDNKFNPRDRKFFESTQSKVNSNIALYTEKSKALMDKYVDSDFDPAYKRMYDSLQVITMSKIHQSVDDGMFNPLAAKQDLIAKKLTLQTEYELAKNSVNSLERLHNKLFSQFTRLVPFEASIQSYERDIDIASKEYLDILDRYNNTSMQTTFVAKLKLPQPAMSGVLQPSKKMLLIILSGVISFVFCLMVLFVLFYFDNSVQSAKQLANATELPVIGQLDKISSHKLNFNDLWKEQSVNLQLENFKDQLRAIRLELNQELADNKILAVTSCSPLEGKTFVALNLAYAYAVTNKKVLLIDGNFIHPELTTLVKTDERTYLEDFLQTGELNFRNDTNSAISILGNKGGGRSILELTNQETTKNRFNQLKSLYDLILIETSALTSTESTKELLLFAEKIVGVFEYHTYVVDTTKEQINYLKSVEEKFTGWIFNKMAIDSPAKPSAKKKS